MPIEVISVKSPFEFDGIDWEGGGYFGCPQLSAQALATALQSPDPWQVWLGILNEAKQGDFTNIAALFDLYQETEDPVLRELCYTLLGDAGPADSISRVVRELQQPANPLYYELALDCCDVLATRGMLADVSTIMAAYRRLATIKDADIIPVYLSNLLEPEYDLISDQSNFSSLDEYEAAVATRAGELKVLFGADQALVFKGERAGVKTLANQLLKALQRPNFPIVFRQRFEASTGIDCTGFYQKGFLQPLSAAAIMEAFLDSPDINKYEDGVRYFFGHRIPDGPQHTS
jgi:hypothetical protein